MCTSVRRQAWGHGFEALGSGFRETPGGAKGQGARRRSSPRMGRLRKGEAAFAGGAREGVRLAPDLCRRHRAGERNITIATLEALAGALRSVGRRIVVISGQTRSCQERPGLGASRGSSREMWGACGVARAIRRRSWRMSAAITAPMWG